MVTVPMHSFMMCICTKPGDDALSVRLCKVMGCSKTGQAILSSYVPEPRDVALKVRLSGCVK